MKRILTALGNQTLNHELKKYIKYDVVSEDLFYQEAVLDFLEIEAVDIVVLSGLLQGQYSMLEFVKEVKKKQLTARIILITDSIEEEEKNLLIAKGIFDILFDNEIEISDVLEAIDREEPINLKLKLEKELQTLNESVKKEKSIQEENGKYEIKSKYQYITKIQRQEVITIFGTNGAGKSTIAAGLVKAFSKKTKAKILLIDLDTLQGNLDDILNVQKVPQNVEILIDTDKKCGINYVADLVLKNRFDTNVLDELVINCGEYDFLSGNTSLYCCQNILSENCYKKLLDAAKQKYDFIVIDISSNIFLDSTKWALQNSSKVLFVTENSNISLKKTTQVLDVIFNLWKIWKEKVKIVLNKTNSNGLPEDVFTKICNLKVIANIKQDKHECIEAYESILETFEYIPRKNFFTYIEKEKEKMLDKIKEKISSNKINQKEVENV